MELDHTLTSRDVINSKITSTLDVATDKWGIKVNRVELKNIIPPSEIQDAMERQMKAEREKRESILRAEGEKQSQILVAEGKQGIGDPQGGSGKGSCNPACRCRARGAEDPGKPRVKQRRSRWFSRRWPRASR